MKIWPLTLHATRLTMYGLVNAYLLREDDGLTLIDTNLGSGAATILKQAAEMGAPIRRILLTHAHYDHDAGLDKIVAGLGSAPEIWMGARETRLYEQTQRGVKTKKLALEPGEPQTPVKGRYLAQKTKVTNRIGSLRAVFTPGHTPGEMSFLDERDGTLYAGDAMVSVRHLRVTGDAPWYFALPNIATWHRITALESALRIATLNPELIACGHGAPVFENIKAKLADALDRAGTAFAHN